MSFSLRRVVNRRVRRALRRNRTRSLTQGVASFEALEPRVLMTGDIVAVLINDLNGNGVEDKNDPGLAGWTVYIDTNRNGSLDAGEPSQVTDIDGKASFKKLDPGNYSVREVLQSGWNPSPGYAAVQEIAVINNERSDATFLNFTPQFGQVQGTIWNDINNDGVRAVDEPGLPDWAVFVDLNGNRIQDLEEPSTITDSNGNYVIDAVPAGDQRVQEVLQFGWETTIGFDTSNTVTVLPGAPVVQDFANFAPFAGSLGGTVWNDLNGDGFRDAGDAGIAGWTVFLDINKNGTLDADTNNDGIANDPEPSRVTDVNGDYNFPFVPEGNYTVREERPAGWVSPIGFDVFRDVAVVGGNATTVDFANFIPVNGTISGVVWNDSDGDGLQGVEPGLPGWTVFADLNNDGIQDPGEPSAITDASGAYSLLDVPSYGARMIREIPQAGWRPTSPGTGAQFVSLLNGEDRTGVNFGNQTRQDAVIGGTIYDDSNKSGTRDAGERGLGGITVYIDFNNNGTLDPTEPSIVTSNDLFYTPGVDESGAYLFTHLAAGDYHVRQIVPPEQSSTPQSEREHLVTLTPGEQKTDVNSGNVYRPNEIHGVKFNDLNGNHVRDAGEAGLGGVTLFLDLDRDNIFDPSEPSVITASDGSYAFSNLTPGAYVVREVQVAGYVQTYPTTAGGILWPGGVSNPAVGNVTPTSITQSLAIGETYHQTVSLTLPGSGALTNMVDVFLLFDDTGSFTGNSPIVRAAFPQIISALQTALPGIDLGFGVGRFEEYANFASEFGSGRPFVLNQPIVAATTTGFSAAIAGALDRTAPGYGGDQPESLIEALFQTVTGRGFDGNNNGNVTDSGPAGLASTQVNPGDSGDVPAFASYTVDSSVAGLAPSGNLGGAGFRAGALPIILAATDTGFNYQPKGETSILGLNGLSLPLSALTQTSRPTTPFDSGAGIQETITGLNALGALVIGLGTNPETNFDPRQDLSAISKLTGAINNTTTTIANGTATPIAPGDPLYFEIASGFGASVANGVTAAIQNAVTNVAVNVTVKASDPRVHIVSLPGVVNGIGAGDTATFDVEFTGDGVPRRFDLQFVREGTNVVLGSIPVVLGTPIPGDGYSFDELEEGEIDDTVDFGNQQGVLEQVNIAPSIAAPASQTTAPDAGIVFSAANSNTITISDVDAGSSPIKVSLAVTHGRLTLASIFGLNFTVGTGTNDTAMTFTGSQTSVNAALAGLTFGPTAGFDGAAALQVDVDDLGNTGLGGPKTAHADVPITVVASPKVTGLLVGGSTWAANFTGYLASQNLGDADGYAIPVGSGEQLAPLPWNNVDQIVLRFNKTLVVQQGDLVVRGVNTPAYSFSGFTTSTAPDGSFEAFWHLAAPLGIDKVLVSLSDTAADAGGHHLDGEWINPTARSTPAGGSSAFFSGDGVAGGAFNFRFNVAPGDVNQNTGINVQDVVLVRNRQGSSTALPANYSIFSDVNANGGINVQDVVLTRNQQGKSLPAGEPALPAAALSMLVVGGAPSSAALVIRSDSSTADAPTPLRGPGAASAFASIPGTSDAGRPWSLRPVDEGDDDTLLRRRRVGKLLADASSLVLREVEEQKAKA